MSLVEWTDAEYELMRAHVKKNLYLDKLITAAIWSWDRVKLSVLIQSFDYCETVGRSRYNEDPNWIHTLIQTFDSLVSESWRATFRSKPPEDADIQRISVQLNARYLTRVLQLNRDSRFATKIDLSDNILIPLIANNNAVKDALTTILSVWTTATSVRWQHRPRIEELLDIAALISEHPHAGEFVSTYAKERLSYDGALIREVLSSGTTAVSSGRL